jgi:hypothetical protein
MLAMISLLSPRLPLICAQRDLVVHPNLLDDPALLDEELGYAEDLDRLFVSGQKYGAPP